jgi:hypothetical protein
MKPTLPDLARAAADALAESSGAKQSIGLKVREYVPRATEEERAAHAAKLNARKGAVDLIKRRSLSDGVRVLRTVNQIWSKEDQKVESPGS